jgi:hypothetical protein
MATYSKEFFTGCATDQGGTGIALAIDSGTFTTIHATPTTTTTLDEIWMYAVNSHSADLKVTIRFGGVEEPEDYIETTVTAESGLVLLVPGLILQGMASTGQIILGAAATGDEVAVYGYVNRITA